MATRLRSVPYRGDDMTQSMARMLWAPMLVLGLLTIAGGLVLATISGVRAGDFFGTGAVDDLGASTALAQLAIGLSFLGMAFILAAITMVLVNIIRALRDTGRDVQASVGAADTTQLRKPMSGTLISPVMLAGLLTVIGGFVLAVILATKAGGIDPQGFVDLTAVSAADRADIGVVEAWGRWLPPLMLLGLGLIFTAIVLALRTVMKGMRFQAQRIEDLARERGMAA